MKPGLVPGARAEVEFEVQAGHLAAFEGQVVHPVLSTWNLIHFMEWAGRRVILPFLEPHEEAVGASLRIRHIAPTAQGDRVTVAATLARLELPKIICRVEARNARGCIGRGTFVQILLPRSRLSALIDEARCAVAATGPGERAYP